MIEVLVGTIASGKSTYTNQRAKEGWVVVSDDAIVDAVHGGNYKLYEEALKPLYKSVEDHILHIAVAMGRNVIVDRGVNVTIRSRKRWVALASCLDVPIWAIEFPLWSPEEHAALRTNSDNRGHDYAYWLWVAERHIKDWQKPTIEEGFAKIRLYEWKD
ncbi:MAG: ATP-binding protein [Proteobacteria bacterium]|nr:ATP-binding protein [Pseudomonadota bacterium]